VDWTLATVAVAVLVVAAVSRPLSGGRVTTTMAFLAIGILVGPRILDAVDVAPSGTSVRVLIG
jgi:hypothetical protein